MHPISRGTYRYHRNLNESLGVLSYRSKHWNQMWINNKMLGIGKLLKRREECIYVVKNITFL